MEQGGQKPGGEFVPDLKWARVSAPEGESEK